MRIKFWPKDGSIPATICNHRHNAVMTFSQATDSRRLNSVYGMELYGFRNNIRLGCHTSDLEGDYQTDMSDQEKTGLIRFDIYFMVDTWVNPITGVLENIPDYSATKWTSAGAAVFSGAVAGQAKATNYPNHGQQMYDVSGGDYGFDYTNGVSGTSAQSELIGVVSHQKNWLADIVGRSPSAASFRIGMTNCYPSLIPYFLGVRNSDPLPAVTSADCDTFYGIAPDGITHLGLPDGKALTRDVYGNFPSSTRWWDMWNDEGFTESESTTYLSAQITKTLSNGGWFRDFTHWHNPVTAGNMPQMDVMLAAVRTAVGSNFIHTCSNGEALEYMFLRTLAKRVRAVEKTDGVYIVVDIVDGFSGDTEGIPNAVPMLDINIPLSVQVDLSGTALSGKTVQSNYGKIRSLGADVYIVEIPFSTQSEAFQGIKITEATTSNVYDETAPTGTAAISGSAVAITTNIPTRAVLFGVAAGGNDFESSLIGRSNELSTTHSIPVTDTTLDYRVGIISDFGQAALITV